MVVTSSRYTRYKTTTGAGVLTALLLVLIFGSPVYQDWVRVNATENTAGDWFLRLLAWPAWRFDSDIPVRDLLATDLRAILLVAFTGLFMAALTGAQLSRAQGTLSQFLAGWSAFIFAGGFAGLLTAFIQTDPSLLAALEAAGAGAGYGLFVGWIVGLATLGGRRP